MSWETECVVCGAKMKFADIRDINQMKWTVLAWIVPSGEPRVVCNKCDYVSPKRKRNDENKGG